MNVERENQRAIKNSHVTDHLANERTYLAWVRTSIGVMAFGFVVEKFALFLKKISIFLKNSSLPELSSQSPSVEGYTSVFGIFLVAFGALLCLFALMKYKSVEKQIEAETYRSSTLLAVILTLAVLFIGAFLITYLLATV